MLVRGPSLLVLLPALARGAMPEQVHLAVAGADSGTYSTMWFNQDDAVDTAQVSIKLDTDSDDQAVVVVTGTTELSSLGDGYGSHHTVVLPKLLPDTNYK